MRCSACGAEVPQAARFCTSCGSALAAVCSAAVDLYRAMEMIFWLPEAEAGLAGVR